MVEGYYYLGQSKVGPVKLRELERDIQRGVTQLTESAYVSAYGSTRGSITFITALFATLGYDACQGVKAQLTHRNNRYRLRVHTVSGNELVFEGVSGGYWGEGTRGCHDILKALGFNKNQVQYPFTREEFQIRRKVPTK